MARHGQLRARFFVSRAGVVMEKDRPVGEALRHAIFHRDGGKCRECYEPVQLFTPRVVPMNLDVPQVAHVDHIIPRARGGRAIESNLRLLCSRCNLGRGADL